MVRKKTVIYGIVMLICWALPILLLAIGKNEYLYPNRVPIKFGLWLLVYFLISLVGLTIILAIKFLKKSKFRFLSILLIISLIPQYFINATCLFAINTAWESSSQNVEDYGIIDPYFDSQFEFCDLKMSELMSKETISVNRYEYNYQSQFAAISFDVYFEIQLSQENYDYYKNIFIQDMKLQNGTENGGRLVVFEDTPTTVDKWEEMYIDYSDSTCTFCMKFKGECYT